MEISIDNDVEVESEETFRISLGTLPELDRRISINPSRATVTINDDDGMYVFTNTPHTDIATFSGNHSVTINIATA